MKQILFLLAFGFVFGYSQSMGAQTPATSVHPEFLVNRQGTIKVPLAQFAQQPIPAPVHLNASHDWDMRFVQNTTDGPADSTIDVETDSAPPPAEKNGFWPWLKSNWQALILPFWAFLEAIVRLTPTNTDNSILNFLKSILDWLIPNRRTGGGTH